MSIIVKTRQEIITSPDNPIRINWSRSRNPRGYYLAWHDEMEIQFIIAGAGCYFIDGNTFPFRANSVIIIQPREIHRLLPNPKFMVEKVCIMFDLNRMGWSGNLIKDAKKLNHHVGLTMNESDNMEKIICNICREEKTRKPCWQAMAQAMLIEFILHIKRAGANLPPGKIHPIVSRSLDYVEENYISPAFNIRSLAKELNVSERHLLRLFINDVGMSVKHYVLQRRVFQAQRIIRSNPAFKLEAVSEAVGFKQYTLFYRMFKNFTGSSPCANVRF